MTVLDRYIVRTILGSVLLVTMVLLVLGALFVFIDQQDDIGVGHYTAVSALWFTLLNLPQQAYELLPITVLIGSLLGLGSLARGSELTVVRASGVSIARLAGTALVAALLLCRSLRGRTLSEATAVMQRFPQVKENVRVGDKQLTPAILEEVERTNAELAGRGRVLVRPSGTEPVVRVLAEAENEQEADRLCGTIAALVSTELG